MVTTLRTTPPITRGTPVKATCAELFAIYELNAMTQFSSPKRSERLQHFEIIWIKDAEGILSLDECSYPLENNTLYCLGPAQMRVVTAGRMNGYYMRIAPELLHVLQNQFDLSFLIKQANGKMQPVSLPRTETSTALEDIALHLLKEYNFGLPETRYEIIKGFLNVFIIYLSREFEQVKDEFIDRSSLMLRRFIELLNEKISVKKLVSDYAEELCVTPNYLNCMIKKVSGLTASHHIQQHIIREAKRQAIYSGKRMKEIAYHLGFEDQAHFSKFFKNYSGVTFTSFRKGLMSGNVPHAHYTFD